MSWKKWTNEEDAIIVGSVFERNGDFQILAERLGRTPGAVYRRYCAIRESDCVFGEADLARLFQVSRVTGRNWMVKGYFGKVGVMVVPTYSFKGERLSRRVLKWRVICFLEDPFYSWLYDVGLLPQRWQQKAVGAEKWYVAPLQVAEEIGVSIECVKHWRKRGYLPGVQVPGRLFVFPRPVVDQHKRMYLDGKPAREIAADNWSLVREIAGFDEEVSAPWRRPFVMG